MLESRHFISCDVVTDQDLHKAMCKTCELFTCEDYAFNILC